MAEGRERDDEDDHEGHERDQVLEDAPQQLHLVRVRVRVRVRVTVRVRVRVRVGVRVGVRDGARHGDASEARGFEVGGHLVGVVTR